MLSVRIRGVKLVCEVPGRSGPCAAISPGGRRGLAPDRGQQGSGHPVANPITRLGRPGASIIDFLRRRERMA